MRGGMCAQSLISSIGLRRQSNQPALHLSLCVERGSLTHTLFAPRQARGTCCASLAIGDESLGKGPPEL